MVTIEISQCIKALNFQPNKAWSPLLPSYAWRHKENHYLLCGFDRSTGAAIVLNGELSDVLFEIYQSLSLSECARLQSRVKELLEVSFNPSPLLGYRVSNSWLKLSEVINETPMTFQQWVSARSVTTRELEVLNLIPLEKIVSILDRIAALQPSKSIGSLIIDLSAQMLGQGHDTESVLEKSEIGIDEWTKELNKKRYPETHKRDQNKQQVLKSLPWPAHSQVKWIRDGDQAGIEVRFQVFSDKDLARQLEGFAHVQQVMNGDSWNAN